MSLSFVSRINWQFSSLQFFSITLLHCLCRGLIKLLEIREKFLSNAIIFLLFHSLRNNINSYCWWVSVYCAVLVDEVCDARKIKRRREKFYGRIEMCSVSLTSSGQMRSRVLTLEWCHKEHRSLSVSFSAWMKSRFEIAKMFEELTT